MKNTTKTLVLALALAGVLAIGGIAAYFTDADTVTNPLPQERYLSSCWNQPGILSRPRTSLPCRKSRKIRRSEMTEPIRSMFLWKWWFRMKNW